MDSYQAIKFIYQSYVRAKPFVDGDLPDLYKRHPEYCRRLLLDAGLILSAPPSVLITGSKGKGSTSALIAALAQQAGRKTGLFTGPHLVDFCERIRVDGEKIPEPEFVRLVDQIRPLVVALDRSLPCDHYVGPVGITLAVALLWFRSRGADFHVIECGRGGLSDDANVLANRWSVITPVMLEHRKELGPTLLDIAANKLGIVKSGQELCISYRQDPEVERLMVSLCSRLKVPLKLMGRDFDVDIVDTGLHGSRFRYRSRHRHSEFSVPLPGRFQAYNAGVALALTEEICPGLDDTALQRGLAGVRWPGRCELVPGEPPVILDGAINAQSAAYLRELLVQTNRPLQLIIGVPADKDWQGVVRTLAPVAAQVWLTTASNPHLEFPSADQAVAEALRHNPASMPVSDVSVALEQAAAAAADSGGVVGIVGTQSLIRDAKVVLGQKYGRGVEW